MLAEGLIAPHCTTLEEPHAYSVPLAHHVALTNYCRETQQGVLPEVLTSSTVGVVVDVYLILFTLMMVLLGIIVAVAIILF